MLGIFALITASLLAGTYLGTKDRIADAKREVAKRALLEIIPLEQHSNDLLMDTLPVPANFLHTLGLDDEGGDINIARQGAIARAQARAVELANMSEQDKLREAVDSLKGRLEKSRQKLRQAEAEGSEHVEALRTAVEKLEAKLVTAEQQLAEYNA